MSKSDLQPRGAGSPLTIDTSREMSGDDDDFDMDTAETVMYDTGEGDVEIVLVPRRRPAGSTTSASVGG